MSLKQSEDRGRVSLTSCLDDKNSELSRFFEAVFPNRSDVLARYRLADPVLRVPAPAGVNAGTVGTAFDYLLRFELDPRPNLHLALAGAKLAGPHFVDLLAGLADRLEFELDARPALVPNPGPAAGKRSDPEVAGGCYLAALLTEVFRSGAIWPGSPLSEITGKTTLDSALDRIPAAAISDLIALLEVAHEEFVPTIAGRHSPLWLGPVFEGSRWVSADADIIASGLLVDVKTGSGARRKDGSRYNNLDKLALYQLLGYLLFDFPDEYRIDEIGLYAARYGQFTTWTVSHLLGELSAEPVALSDLRHQCAQVVRGSRFVPALPVTGRPDASPSRRRLIGRPALVLDEFLSIDDPEPDIDTVQYGGQCKCGARFEFTTQILPGFADSVDAFCPRCGASLGSFREDVGPSIVVNVLD
jgi:hypothetical protein